MQGEQVIFPIHAENLHFTWKTRYFFLRHKISIKSGASFPLDDLRKQYTESEELGAHIYQELFLYGFSFRPVEFIPFYPPDVMADDMVLIANAKGSFDIHAVKERKLRKIIASLDPMVSSDLNGIYLVRLEQLVGGRMLKNTLERLGYRCQAWDKLDVYSRGSGFLWWPEGREGVALPRFFIPLISTLSKADNRLLSFYKRVGLKRYGDFLNLTLARCEFISRLIMRLKLDRYHSGEEQLSLWRFVYDMEQCKRDLNEANLPLDFLYVPLANGLNEVEEKCLSKWVAGGIPYASNFDLAYAFEQKTLPDSLLGEAPLLASLNIRDLSIFSKGLLKKPIDYYRVEGSIYNFAVNPEFIMEGVISSLEMGHPLSLVSYSGKLLYDKVNKSLSQNDPEAALDYLFAARSIIPLTDLKQIPGMAAYLSANLGKYRIEADLGAVGLSESILNLSLEKQRISSASMVGFEYLKGIYEKYGFSLLSYLKEKEPSIAYAPYPVLLYGRMRKKGEKLSVMEL